MLHPEDQISDELPSTLSRSVKNSNNTHTHSTSSTSSTGAAFRDVYPAPIRHLFSTSSTAKANILVEETEKGEKRLIASKAALIVADDFYGIFAWCSQSQTWHYFTGAHWEPISPPDQLHESLTRYLFTACGEIGFTPVYTNQIITILQHGGLLALPQPPCNSVPFSNGLLDSESLELAPITHQIADTFSLPYPYTADAACPVVQKWILEAVDGDQEIVQLLRAWLGALLRGMASLQKFLHLIGPGGTGKSTFLRLAEALVGTRNAISTDLKQLEQNRFESAGLYGKRLALIADSDKYGGSVNMLKAITGQDPIRLERKHQQQSGTFVFSGLVVLASNEPLATTDYTSGLERRRITVNFEKRITVEERASWQSKGGESAVLHSELPGVVNWVLSLSREDIQHTINNPPQRTAQANLEAMAAGNPLVDWLRNNVTVERGALTQIGKKDERKSSDREDDGKVYFAKAQEWLFANYLTWCMENGREALSSRRFREKVVDMCRTLGADVMETKRNWGMCIQGIRLLKVGEKPYPWCGFV